MTDFVKYFQSHRKTVAVSLLQHLAPSAKSRKERKLGRTFGVHARIVGIAVRSLRPRKTYAGTDQVEMTPISQVVLART